MPAFLKRINYRTKPDTILYGVYPKFCVNQSKMQNEAVEFEPGGDLPPGFVYYIRYRTPITAGRYRPTGIGVLLHKTDNRNRI